MVMPITFIACSMVMMFLALCGIIMTTNQNTPVAGGVFKCFATSLMLVAVIVSHVLKPSALSIYLIVATSFLILGDVFLSFMVKATKKTIFSILGALSFLIGYGCLGVYMTIRTDANWSGIATLITVVTLFALGFIQINFLDKESLGKLKTGIIGYMVIISLLVTATIFTGKWYAILGGILLYISDSWIAHSTYGKFKAIKQNTNEVMISMTYYLGLIALFGYIVL